MKKSSKVAPAKAASKAARAVSAGGAKPAAKESQPLRISIEAPPGTPSYYLNIFEVGHSRHDIQVRGARMSSRPTKEEAEMYANSGQIELEAEMVFYISPTLVPGLVKALQNQFAKYEERFGPIAKKEKSSE